MTAGMVARLSRTITTLAVCKVEVRPGAAHCYAGVGGGQGRGHR